ncbi:MAG: hypothetical protein QM765_07870 [Myxococcales bacterium]
MNTILRSAALAALLLHGQAALAQGADSAPATSATSLERPWAAGVSAESQKEALQVFQEANALFSESKYAQALSRYRDALRVWDHPGVRFNTAVALINLDQPLAAYENLEAALKYGEAPFSAENYKQAMIYLKLLAGQVAQLEVVCDEPGAVVSLDGEQLFVAPGNHSRRLLPGAHQLVAVKPGFVTETRALQLTPGKSTVERVVLQNVKSVPVKLVRRWESWMPWTVLGAGLVVALAGTPLMLDAQSNYDRYDSDLARLCPSGCKESDLPATVIDSRQRGRVENGGAVAAFVVGGLLTASGVVLLTLNQPHPVDAAATDAAPVTVLPVFGEGFAGVAASGRF